MQTLYYDNQSLAPSWAKDAFPIVAHDLWDCEVFAVGPVERGQS